MKYILLFIPSLAWAQGIPLDSIRAPFSINMTYTLTLQTESINSLGKVVANSGQVKKVGVVDLIKDSVILAEIPGPKTTKTIVSGLRATFVTTGGVGFVIDPITAHITLPNIELPIGQTLAVRYDMPAQTFDVLTLKWGPAGSGRLQWKVGAGVLAKDISGPPVTPAPIITTTPNCSKSPPVAVLIDTPGDKWTTSPSTAADKAPDQVLALQNGVQRLSSVTFIQLINGEIYFYDPLAPVGSGDPGTGWGKWLGNAWQGNVPVPSCP